MRTGQHIYAQVFSADGAKVLAAASTCRAESREGLKTARTTTPLPRSASAIAEKAKAAGIEKVAFDRSGYRYHGRIKALADAAREGWPEVLILNAGFASAGRAPADAGASALASSPAATPTTSQL